MNELKKDDAIFISGGKGLVGSAVVGLLQSLGYKNIMSPTSKELDLTSFEGCHRYFRENRPKYVFHFSGAVYGLGGNLKDPARSYTLNTMINTNLVDACQAAGVQKVLAMGSICAYPQFLKENELITEDMVFNGRPNPGEEAYGTSKRGMLVHLEACRKSSSMDFVYLLSTNLYGPNDRFNTTDGHVIPSLIKKFHDAKTREIPVLVWGDGTSNRDFLYSKDAAVAILKAMESVSGAINLATGKMHQIKEVVQILSEYTKTEHLVSYDKSKPKGHEFYGFDVEKLSRSGFSPEFSLERGLRETFDWFEQNSAVARI